LAALEQTVFDGSVTMDYRNCFVDRFQLAAPTDGRLGCGSLALAVTAI